MPRLSFALAIVASLLKVSASAETLVSVGAPTLPSHRCRGVVRAIPGCATDCANPSQERPVGGNSPATFSLDDSLNWRFELLSSECWAPPIDLLAHAPGKEVAFDAVDATTVTATLSPKIAVDQVKGSVAIAPDTGPSSFLPLTCSLKGQHLRCTAPMTALGFRFAVPGAAPVYRWVEIDGRRTVDLGTLELDELGAIAGVVTSLKSTAAPTRISVYAQNDSDDGKSPAALKAAAANRHGFFQLSGLEGGAYTIVISREGFASTRLRDVIVKRGSETLLKPVDLQRPVALDVYLQPAVDPYGNPWLVQVYRFEHARRGLYEVKEPASLAGAWSHTLAELGTYVVSIADSKGSVFARRTIEVDGLTSPVTIAIESLLVEGHVRAGDRPVSGELNFATDAGANASASSDDEGHFTVVLPAEGKWRVDLHPRGEQNLRLRSLVVKVERKLDAGTTPLDVNFPGGVFKGRVVDDRGDPAAAAVDLYDGYRLVAQTYTGPGDFEIQGVPPKQLLAQATDSAGGDSGMVPVTITESGDQRVTLTIRKQRVVKGWVEDQQGRPIAGALMWFTATTLIGEDKTSSGPSGEFSIKVPADTPALDLVVLASDLPTRLLRVPLAEETAPLNIVMRDAGAMLTVRMKKFPPFPFIAKDGALFHLQTLFPPPRDRFGPRGLRKWAFDTVVEPGRYTLCPEQRWSADCRSVVVAANAQQEISLE